MRTASLLRSKMEAAGWDRHHRRPNYAEFREKILPKLKGVLLGRMVKAQGYRRFTARRFGAEYTYLIHDTGRLFAKLFLEAPWKNLGKGYDCVAAEESSKEASYYSRVKDWLTPILRSHFQENFHLEITASGNFSSTLKAPIPEHREIIFSFLRDAAPDITGFVVKEHEFQFVVVEIKARRVKLDDIYQTKKYADLFDARYALLISTVEIPEELKRLSRAAPQLLALPGHGTLTLIQLQVRDDNSIGATWLSEDPFVG